MAFYIKNFLTRSSTHLCSLIFQDDISKHYWLLLASPVMDQVFFWSNCLTQVGRLLIKKGSGLGAAEKLKTLDFLPMPEEGNIEEERKSSNSQLEVQGCCSSSQGNESIASPGEEDNSEDSDGDIEIEEMSESESLGSIEIEIETSIDTRGHTLL